MTELPFVWAFWAGRPGGLSPAGVSALVAARDAGIAASDAIAAAYCGPERAARGQAYLRENIRYTLGEHEQAGLLAVSTTSRNATAIVDERCRLAFFDNGSVSRSCSVDDH